MQAAQNQRRRKPSYTLPFLYEGLEVLLIFIVIAIFEGSLQMKEWGSFSYALGIIWFMYTLYKLSKVLGRASDLKR